LASLDWHTISSEEALQRLSVSRKSGLDSEQAKRKLSQGGPNKVSPPPQNLLKKWLGYVFGGTCHIDSPRSDAAGFGSLLFIASILCFIAWKPLGEPAPSAANLALAVVLLVVVFLQTGFNAWQDYSTGRVMASLTGMLPKEVIVLRDGQEMRISAHEIVTGDLVSCMSRVCD
jgi:sodium/potassium-transporting ATPase subunit alpha